MNTTDLWNTILSQIKPSVSFSHYNLYFTKTHIGDIKNINNKKIYIVSCQNVFVQEYLIKNYKEKIAQLLTQITQEVLSVEVEIEKKTNSNKDQPELFSPETQKYVTDQEDNFLTKNAIRSSNLRNTYTFENFAVSPTNEVAYAAATAVAKNPGTSYNPLFLYGDVGVGKTHLMQAIGIRILEKNPKFKIIYCPGEHFTNEIIEAIRNKKTPQFRNKYRLVDGLLIDDIQFIAGKNTVQEEFFHTFNTILSNGGQVILTSDRPPSEIQLLEDRLRSRFEEGLIIDIQQPNFELRTAILLIKSKQMNIELPMDLAQEIASEITSTRLLQGFLTKLLATSTFTNEPISKNLVLKMLKKEFPGKTPQPKTYINPKEVIKIVSKFYDIPTSALIGPNRSKPIVTPRQYAMYLLKNDLGVSYVEIGRLFGDRDHTTVMHAVEKITNIISISSKLQIEISTIRKEMYG